MVDIDEQLNSIGKDISWAVINKSTGETRFLTQKDYERFFNNRSRSDWKIYEAKEGLNYGFGFAEGRSLGL